MLNQDLHIHTIYSKGDRAIVLEQTPELISKVRHAKVIGISDHIECISEKDFGKYKHELVSLGLKIGTEIDGERSVDKALNLEPGYFIYHCYNNSRSYKAIEKLLATDKPVIIAHPMIMETDLSKVPGECYVEINNRYVWRNDWQKEYGRFAHDFKFVLSSDAHQPNWLNQNVAKYVAKDLNIKETLIF